MDACTTKKQYNNDQLIQQGAFLVVKISTTMTRRKTGRRKYMFLRRVVYLIVNILKPGCKYTHNFSQKEAGQFRGRFWRANSKRRRLHSWYVLKQKAPSSFLLAQPDLRTITSSPFPLSLLPWREISLNAIESLSCWRLRWLPLPSLPLFLLQLF